MINKYDDKQKNKRDRVLNSMNPKLSDEQIEFIDTALKGHNILVDACIGSGKTTSIQALCNIISPENKILYLTYNKLLKIDAKDKIKNRNVMVTNYHGFVYPYLMKNNIKSSVGESIKTFLNNKNKIKTAKYDILIIDEYQDINEEISLLLEHIKSINPEMQIIAVGDMAQKIYDFTTLDVFPWIKDFLENFITIDFTNCFRLNAEFANKLSISWNKPIKGVNNKQVVRTMELTDAVLYLKNKEPEDIIALGSKRGEVVELLNRLEAADPYKFNKYTMYISVGDKDMSLSPDPNAGIFTTFDSSKGMERKICVVFDFDNWYLKIRREIGDTADEIIKNIFLVAASRGKEEIIFVNSESKPYNNDNHSHPTELIGNIKIEDFINMKAVNKKHKPFEPSNMFDFKYTEDIVDTFNMLNINEIDQVDNEIIDIKTHDGLLDISSSIGMYAPAAFFKDINAISILDNIAINKMWDKQNRKSDYYYYLNALKYQKYNEFGGCYDDIKENPKNFNINSKPGEYETTFKHKEDDIQWQLLVLLAAETGIKPYIRQIRDRYIDSLQKNKIITRLSTEFDIKDNHEVPVNITYNNPYEISTGNINGRIDVIHDNKVYELKFVNELSYNHYLQCAIYMVMSGYEIGRLWNIKTNQMMEIKIPDRQAFMDQVIKTITKRQHNKFEGHIPNIIK